MKWKYKGKHWDVVDNNLILYFDCLIGHKSIEIKGETINKSGMTEAEYIKMIVQEQETEVYHKGE